MSSSNISGSSGFPVHVPGRPFTPVRSKLSARVVVQQQQSSSASSTPSSPRTPRATEASPQVKARLAELRRAKAAAAAAAAASSAAHEDGDASKGNDNVNDSGDADLNGSTRSRSSLSSHDGLEKSHSRPSSRTSVNTLTVLPLDSPVDSLEFGLTSLSDAIEKAKTTGRLNICSRSLPNIPVLVYEFLVPRGSPYHPSNSGPAKPFTALVEQARHLSLSTTLPQHGEDSTDSAPSSSIPWWEIAELTTLKASNNEFDRLDVALAGFASLEVLDLHHNRIPSPLPAQLGTLTNLSRLNLANNRLTEWPIEILALVHLQELDLSCNQLTELWPCEGWQTQIKGRMKGVNAEVRRWRKTAKRREAEERIGGEAGGGAEDVSLDSISSESTAPDTSAGEDFWATFPSTPIKQGAPTRSALHERSEDPTDYTALLPKLAALNLSGNRLSSSTLSSDRLSVLPSALTSLDLSHNNIKGQLPLETFGRLANLKELDLAKNQLDDGFFVATTGGPSGPHFPALQTLNLAHNALDSLGLLEHVLDIPNSRPVEYLGVPSPPLKRAMDSAPSETTKLPKLVINLTDNLLRDEALRRKTARRQQKEHTRSALKSNITLGDEGSTEANKPVEDDNVARGQTVLDYIDALRERVAARLAAGQLDSRTIATLAQSLQPLQALLETSATPASPASRSNTHQMVRTPQPASTAERLASSEVDNDPARTSWSARKKKMQEAAFDWAPL